MGSRAPSALELRERRGPGSRPAGDRPPLGSLAAARARPSGLPAEAPREQAEHLLRAGPARPQLRTLPPCLAVRAPGPLCGDEHARSGPDAPPAQAAGPGEHAGCAPREDARLPPGPALPGRPCGQVTGVEGAGVARFACASRPARPHAPATALPSSPADLTKFEKGSEKLTEEQVAQLAINVAVVWGEIDEPALTRAQEHSLMLAQAGSPRDMV